MAVTSNMSINVSRNKRRAKSHVLSVAHLLYQLPTKVSIIAFAQCTVDICTCQTMISYGYNHLLFLRYQISEFKIPLLMASGISWHFMMKSNIMTKMYLKKKSPMLQFLSAAEPIVQLTQLSYFILIMKCALCLNHLP